MNQRKREMITAVALGVIAYTSSYFLYEPGTPGIDSKQGMGLFLRGVSLAGIFLIGYIGLLHHEAKWVKFVWVLLHLLLAGVMLINKLAVWLFHQPLVSGAIQSPFETFLVFLLVAYLPRWLKLYHKPSV